MADTVLGNGLILTNWADEMANQQDRAYLSYQRQKAAEDYQRQRAQEDASNAARQQYANGNFQAARQTAAAGNAWDTWQKIDDTQKAQVAAQAADIGGAAYNLARLPKGQQRMDYFNSFVPTLKAHGMTDAEIAQYANSGFLDNDDMLHGYADKAIGIKNLYDADQAKIKREYDRDTDLMKPVTAADGAVLTRGEDGSYQAVYTPGTKPMQQILQNEDGSYSYVNVPGTAGNSYAPGGGGDTTRLMNYQARAAGDASIPQNVQNLGQFSDYGISLNRRGVKSSAAGTYQITAGTYREFAPKVLGPNWRNAPLSAQTEDAIGKAIYESTGGDPAKLRGRWTSLSAEEARSLRGKSWEQARGIIAAGESGGSIAPQGPGPRINPNSGIQVQNLGGGRTGPLWKDETATIGGQQVFGQRNQKTGEFKPMGAGVNKAPKAVTDPKRAIQNAQNGYDTVMGILKSPGLGYISGKSSILPVVPGTAAADARAMVETLKSQTFLSQIGEMKGMGALTDAEGAKLTTSISSLDLRQSDEQLRKSLERIGSYFVLAKKRAEAAMHGGGNPQAQSETRTVNGRTYVRVQGGWKAQ